MKKKLSHIQINIIICIIFMIFFYFKHKSSSLYLTLCNGFFIIGICYFCIGLATNIRNIGFFKSMSYLKYRVSKNSLKKIKFKENDTSPLPDNMHDFYTYVADKYSEKWNSKPYYIVSIPMLTLSIIFLLLYYYV